MISANCSVVVNLSRFNRPCGTQCCSAKMLDLNVFQTTRSRRVAKLLTQDPVQLSPLHPYTFRARLSMFVARSSLGASSPWCSWFRSAGWPWMCCSPCSLSRGRSSGSRDIPGSSSNVPMAVKSGSPVGLASVRDAVPPHPLRRLSHGDDDLPPWHHRPHKRARSIDDVPSLDEGDAYRRRSHLVSKTIANFARYPERRPAGVVPAGDGSLDIDQVWIYWGWRMGFSRSQHLQHVADHAIADSGRRRFLLHSDHEGRSWVSVAAPFQTHASTPPPRVSPKVSSTARIYCGPACVTAEPHLRLH